MKRKRSKKPLVFKVKPLTKAQKLKLFNERKALTRRMRATDPFYIHADDVPSGKSYQWFALSHFGVPNDDAIDRAKDDGWKSVPFARHNFGRKFRAKSGIVVNDMLLMENSSIVTKANRKKEEDDARQMLADSPCSTINQGGRFPIVSSSFVVSSDYKRILRDSPPVIVPVTISFSMDAGWQDTASSLGLTNEEYARRRILMTMPILAGEPTGGDDALYAAVTLRIEK